MPSFKLVYFPARARAEPIRLLFAQAGVEYEDVRLNFSEFYEEYKHVAPFGALPVLEVDGKPLAETLTIVRYLAKLFGLAGKNAFDQAIAESVIDALSEINFSIFLTTYYERDDEVEKNRKLKKLKEEKVTNHLRSINKMIKENNNEGNFIVGDSYNKGGGFVADDRQLSKFNCDIYLYDTVTNILQTYGEEILKEYPQVAESYKCVGNLNNIKAWVAKRPKTWL